MKLPKLLKNRWFLGLLALGVVGFAIGVWMLLHPAAFWLKPWRPQPEAVGNRFIIGPYPIEKDFQALQQKGVTTIISLLDAQLPYEAVLLEDETELAEKYGMRVLNFPVKSILGQGFGERYYENSEAAAKAALASEGVVYIHCYLGVHRADNVRQLLLQAGTATYSGEVLAEHVAAVERVQKSYREGRMEEVLAQIAELRLKTVDMRLLEGWANLRLHRVDEARALFEAVTKDRGKSNLLDAANGLGYCALRKNELDEASKQFEGVLAQRPDDPQATEGLGYVRYRQGRSDEARELFARVLARFPDNAEVRLLYQKLQGVAAHIVLVVIDGLRSDAIAAAPAPNLSQLAAGGAVTLEAKAVELPETLPSLATIVTGLAPARHGVEYDDDRTTVLQERTIFTSVHAAGGRSALYFGKTKVDMLAAETTAARYGPGLRDLDWDAGAGTALVARFAAEFPQAPFEFALIHLREPDFVGHAKGWMGPEYLAAVRESDKAVGAIRQVIAESPAAGTTMLIVTADHGGQGNKHARSAPASWSVPFICHGPGAKNGPITAPVTLADVAPTVVALLGLPPLPDADGRAVGACLGQ